MKVGMVSLGCPKNLVDSEIMLGILQSNGFQLENNLNESQIIIVNTCGFISDAKEESINRILEMSELKTSGECEILIVTGCLAQRYSEEILSEIPEVDAVLGTASYGEIFSVIEKISTKNQPAIKLLKPLTETSWLENPRVISTQNGSVYLKISEGCDNCCTYCIIPKLRGRFRSREKESIFQEASRLAQSGVKELILVGQDTTRYGMDIYETPKLVELIQEISLIEGIEWIRLLYCYPEMVSDELILEIAKNPKVCKYIDIPMQHASDEILKRMGRRTSQKELETLIFKLREANSDITIRSTFIVGFPGETEADFEILKRFLIESKLDHVGVFKYSKEEGTSAAKMKSQIKKSVKEERFHELMTIQRQISLDNRASKVGKTIKVLADNVSEDGIFYFGRSQHEAPEIDNLIYFTSQWQLESGQLIDVIILNNDEYDLIGEVVDEPK